MRNKENIIGYLYFYIHLIVEIVCFFYLTKIDENNFIIWIIPFIYDGFAFVPQAIIGYFNDKYQKIKIGLCGIILLFISFVLFLLKAPWQLSLILLCFGNGLLHIKGAEMTLRHSQGKLSPSAIFVSGGSFGVIIGRTLAKSFIPSWIILILILTIIPFMLLGESYVSEIKNKDCLKFDYVKKTNKYGLIVLLIVFIVVARGYMGYGIPTSWNKTILQTILFYITMGFGKALGGILSDKFGIRKIAIFSTLFAIPFLCIGDNMMIISLFGILLFSMTMSITLALLVSILKNSPGLAFGLTTIGLFLGTIPIFFFEITSTLINCIVICLLSIFCAIIFSRVIKKE